MPANMPPTSKPTVDESSMQQVFNDVLTEIRRATDMFPNVPADMVRRVSLVVEEAGESLQAALDCTRAGAHFSVRRKHRIRLYEELIQTAAMAIRVATSLAKESK